MTSALLMEQLRSVVDAADIIERGPALEEYTHDATFLTGTITAAVRARSTEQVAAVLAACHAAGTPVVARGAGTSLVGGPVATAGGVVLSLESMDSIEVDADNACAVVGAGAINGNLQAAAAAVGLMYPPDPGSVDMSTIGGNVACNAGGMSCLKYGVTADYVLGLTVVLADGRVLRLGGRTRKRASGYRLAQLFVGSEGTLGVITEVIVKLIPRPRHRAVALVAYQSVVEAGQGVARLLAGGYLPCALELMNRVALRMVAAELPAGLPAAMEAILIIEQDGNDLDVVHAELNAMVEVLGGLDNRIAADSMQRERLWRSRRNMGKVLLAMPQNSFSEDVSVPISAVPEMLRRVEEIGTETGLSIPVVGHAGDGNLHPILVFDDSQRDLVGPAAMRIFDAALELGGSISGEHGLGALKRDHAAREHGALSIELMHGLKDLLDPSGILNPHKVLPEAPADSAFLERQPGWGAGPGHGPRRSEPGT